MSYYETYADLAFYKILKIFQNILDLHWNQQPNTAFACPCAANTWIHQQHIHQGSNRILQAESGDATNKVNSSGQTKYLFDLKFDFNLIL